jgi:hypothetical protein
LVNDTSKIYAGCLVAAVGTDQAQTEAGRDQVLEGPAGRALVAVDGQPGTRRVGAAGVGQQPGGYLALPVFGLTRHQDALA